MFSCAKIAKDICQKPVQLYTYTAPPGTTCISSSAYATNGASCACSYAGGTNTIELGNHYAGNKAHDPSCKCAYCGCTNDHIYGTCDYCGAPLGEV